MDNRSSVFFKFIISKLLKSKDNAAHHSWHLIIERAISSLFSHNGLNLTIAYQLIMMNYRTTISESHSKVLRMHNLFLRSPCQCHLIKTYLLCQLCSIPLPSLQDHAKTMPERRQLLSRYRLRIFFISKTDIITTLAKNIHHLHDKLNFLRHLSNLTYEFKSLCHWHALASPLALGHLQDFITLCVTFTHFMQVLRQFTLSAGITSARHHQDGSIWRLIDARR